MSDMCYIPLGGIRKSKPNSTAGIHVGSSKPGSLLQGLLPLRVPYPYYLGDLQSDLKLESYPCSKYKVLGLEAGTRDGSLQTKTGNKTEKRELEDGLEQVLGFSCFRVLRLLNPGPESSLILCRQRFLCAAQIAATAEV